MKKVIILFILMLVIVIGKPAFASNIKLAIVAPEGSTWVNVMNEMGEELKKRTAGRWGLTIYAGGVAGDEKVVLKKMRIGQIDAAGFTGVGLGEIYPAIRVLELPFLFRSSEEVDYVVQKLLPVLEKGFRDKGFEFLGWAESGFVHIFSNKPIKGVDDMNGVKMWVWQGDPLAQEMYRAMDVVPVPLPITDVLMALQTKMIDGVYAPPLGAIALQWFAKTKYMSDAKLVNSVGALLVTKRALSRMSGADQKAFKDVAAKYSKKLVGLTRQDNLKSVATLKTAGLDIISVPEKNLTELTIRSKKVWDNLAGELYPKELLDRTTAYVEEYRKGG